jgi:hypothetical protein
MIWALLAAWLRKQPAWIQALVFGLCVGLFIAAAANADNRDPLLSSLAVVVLVAAVISGAAFYLALRAQQRHSSADAAAPAWIDVVYLAVWLLSLLAAVRALFGDGGLKVAALAIVPIVLLLPNAISGIRLLLRRPRTPETGAPPATHPDGLTG